MQDFSSVERVKVEYATSTKTLRGTGTKKDKTGVCSDDGTTVTVTFESVLLEVRQHRRHIDYPRLLSPHLIVYVLSARNETVGHGGMQPALAARICLLTYSNDHGRSCLLRETMGTYQSSVSTT